tara:strand:+ start:843 stop:1538 length:696 start_codon:yes stop_codon:yes gene_type:complete
MSKASEKREIEQYNQAYNTMNRATLTLRERYYASAVNFHTTQLENRLQILQEKLQDATDSYQLSGLPESIKRTQRQLDNKFTNQLGWVAEAKENFEMKLQNVATKLVQFGLAAGRLEVQDTWIESAQEMSFKIKGTIYNYKEDDTDLGTAHARLIWVNCTEKISHWRFICTQTNKPGTKNNPIEQKVEVENTQTKKQQIMILFNAGKTAKQIQMLIGGNVSYIRTIIRNNK